MEERFFSGEGGRTVFLQFKTPLFPDCSQLELHGAKGGWRGMQSVLQCNHLDSQKEGRTGNHLDRCQKEGRKARETTKTERASRTYSQL